MTCNPGDPCYHTSLLGKTISGRSTAGYDYRVSRDVGVGRSNLVAYNGVRRMGVPLTDEERMQRHYQQFGTTDLPTRGTGLAAGSQQLSPDMGTLVAGGILGLIFGYFIFTASGREIGYRAGKRVARRM